MVQKVIFEDPVVSHTYSKSAVAMSEERTSSHMLVENIFKFYSP